MSKKNTNTKKKRKQWKQPTALPVYVRLYPDKEQIQKIHQDGGNCRVIYNQLLGYWQEEFEKYKLEHPDDTTDFFTLSLSDFGKKLTQLRNSENFQFLKNTNSKILQQSMRILNQAFSNHKENPVIFKLPTFHSKKTHRCSLTVPRDAIPGGRNIEKLKFVDGNRIDICTGLERILYDCSRKDMHKLNKRQKEVSSITVVELPSGHVYASVRLGYDKMKMEELDTLLALDLGLLEFIITHEEKIEKDSEGYISLTGEELEHKHYPPVREYKEDGQKEKMYEKKGQTRAEHYLKNYKHQQKLLARKEYNRNTHTTQKNKDDNRKNKKFDKLEYRKAKRAENFQKYLDKRAKNKPFQKHKKKKSSPNSAVKQQNETKIPTWQKCSNRYEKQRKLAAKKAEKIANHRKNYQQKLSTYIVRNFQVICAETLNINGMVKNHHLARAILGEAWGQFMDILTYKSNMYGRQISRVDTFFASSKTCPNCGHKLESLDLSVRDWTCPVCGHRHQRDEASADNLAVEGVKILNMELYEKLNGVPFEDNQTGDNDNNKGVNL